MQGGLLLHEDADVRNEVMPSRLRRAQQPLRPADGPFVEVADEAVRQLDFKEPHLGHPRPRMPPTFPRELIERLPRLLQRLPEVPGMRPERLMSVERKGQTRHHRRRKAGLHRLAHHQLNFKSLQVTQHLLKSLIHRYFVLVQALSY